MISKGKFILACLVGAGLIGLGVFHQDYGPPLIGVVMISGAVMAYVTP